MAAAIDLLDLPGADVPVALAAQVYARAGFAPVPVHGVDDGHCTCHRPNCDNAGKHPVGSNWQKRARADLDVARELFDGHDGNIGIVVGEDYIVLDIDLYREGAADALRALGPLPRTLTQRSGGGGEHRIFAFGPGQDPASVTNRKIAPGVDIKTRAGQIVVAPSLHRTGGRYEWIDTSPPALLPDSLYEQIRKRGRVLPIRPPSAPPAAPAARNLRRRAEAYVAKMPPAIAGQGGHDAAFAAARALRGWVAKGLPEGEAYAILVDYNGRCEPPWSERELEHKWQHAARAESIPVIEDREPPSPPGPPGAAGVSGPAPAGATSPPGEPPPPDAAPTWKERLLFDQRRNGRNKVRNHIENAIVVLTYHPEWAGKIRLDTHAQKVIVTAPPWAPDAGDAEWTDNDDVRLSAWFTREVYALNVPKGDCKCAVEVVAESNPCHPFRDYLSALTWDGTRRLDAWLPTFLGAVDTPYTRLVGRWWVMSAVARTFDPGCKADYVLILEGEQGLKKSTALKVLCGAQWFSDTPITIGDKDAYQALQGRVIVELAELHSLKKADADRAKTFFSSAVDNYRPPYARRTKAVPRCCVFAGTVNPDGDGTYLRDATGNRRYWPVHCTRADLVLLGELREQLWAEAVARYRDGVTCPACAEHRGHGRCVDHRWWPDTAEEHEICADAQEPRGETAESDPWYEPIEEYAREESVLAMVDVLRHACKVDVAQMDRAAEMRAARILRTLGFARRRGPRSLGRPWRYERGPKSDVGAAGGGRGQ